MATETEPEISSETSPEISIVAPMHNEEGNAARLAAEVHAVFKDRPHEIIFVNDASTDGTLSELEAARSDVPTLRILTHRKNAGQSRAIRTGVLAARAPIVCTMDGDGQNPPGDLPKLIEALVRPDAPDDLAMVMGRRVGRQDSAWKKFGSRWGNAIRKSLLGDDADDTGCGLKAFRREAYLRLPYFDHQHRFIPALMNREGYRVEFRDVGHRARIAGTSKYSNLGRLTASFSDILGVMWLNTRARKCEGWDES